MIRLAALLLILVILGPGVARACTAPDGLIEDWGPADRLTESERDLFLKFIEFLPEDIAQYPDFWPGVRVAKCDLNGEAPLETVIFAETRLTCSLGIVVCAFIVIAASPDGPRVVLDAAAHKLRIADTVQNGWRDLILETIMAPPRVAQFTGTEYDVSF